jgi:integrase
MNYERFHVIEDSSKREIVIDYILHHCYEKNSSHSHQENITSSLLGWFVFLQEKHLREVPASLREYRIYLMDVKRYADSWIWAQTDKIKAFYKWAFNEGRISKNLFADFRSTKQFDYIPSRAFDQDEIATILSRCKNQLERILVSLTLSAGLRTSELLHLKVEDIDFENNIIRNINNKGKISSVGVHVDLDPQLFKDLKEYCDRREIYNGRVFDYLSEKSYRKIFDRLLPRGTPHLLRKTAGVMVYKNSGYDIKRTQLFMRHSNMETTSRYLSSMITPKGERIPNHIWA